MKRTILSAVFVVWGSASATWAVDAATLLTQGKLGLDMGDSAAAAAAFEAVAADSAAPAALRGEALVRLGAVRRDAGNRKGAAEAFDMAWREYCPDHKEVVALLAQAQGWALPSQERWDAIWKQVKFTRNAGEGTLLSVEWPGVPPGADRGASGPLPLPGPSNRVVPRSPAPGFTEGPTGGPTAQVNTVNLDFKDGDLQDVLRLFADITGLNVVVHPGVRGLVTVKLQGIAWEDALERVLAPNGYAARRVDNVLEVGEPRYLPSGRRFDGAPVDFDFHEVELVETLRQVAQHGARSVSPDPQVAGHMTLKLSQVHWDQAFDMIVRLNGLKWEQVGTTLKVWPR